MLRAATLGDDGENCDAALRMRRGLPPDFYATPVCTYKLEAAWGQSRFDEDGAASAMCAHTHKHTRRPSTYNPPSLFRPCDSTLAHLAPPCSGEVQRGASTTPTVGSVGGCRSPAKHRKLIITALSDGSFPNDLRVHLNN